MNQAANTLIARITWTDDSSIIRIEYMGRTFTVTQEQNPEGTYIGAIRYLQIDMPENYSVALLATSAQFSW